MAKKTITYKEVKDTCLDAINSGGAGAGALENLSDCEITLPIEGEVLVYDETAEKWVNEEIDTLHTYSTTEQVVGEWIDGSEIYEITLEFENAISSSGGTWTKTGAQISTSVRFDGVSFAQGDNNTYNAHPCAISVVDGEIAFMTFRANSVTLDVKYLTFRYVKASEE